MDFRKEWFKNRILDYFDESDCELFHIFLQKDGNQIHHQLDAFLDEKTEMIVDMTKQVFIICKTYHTKIVHEEIEIQEEVTKQRSSSFLQDDKKRDKKGKKKKKGKKFKDKVEDEDDDIEDKLDDDSLLDVAKTDELDDDKQKKKKIKKSGKSSGRVSPFTMMENLPQEEQSVKSKGAVCYVTVKKRIEKVVQVPQFQGHFGILTGDKLESANYYVYFIKKKNCSIPKFPNMEEAQIKMPGYFIVGSFTENILENLEKVLNSVFLSLFRTEIPIEECKEKSSEHVEFHGATLQNRPSYFFIQRYTDKLNIAKYELPISSDESIFRRFLENFIDPQPKYELEELYHMLNNLLDVVKWAQTELHSAKILTISDNLCHFDWENSDINAEIIDECKSSMEMWIRKTESEYKDILSYQISNENLLKEYEHWRRIEINLSVIVDESNSSVVNRISEIVKIHDLSLYKIFESKRIELYQTFVSAKENANVLLTLQYFFKILMYGKFNTISNIIPSLMKSLQTVWVLSGYYSQEKNMERVLIDVKNTLCYRAKTAFNVTTLFNNSWNDIKDDLQNAIGMLQAWKSSYLTVRTRIESTKNHFINRWEFDKRKLFSETDYIGTVIEDIKIVFETVQSYRSLFVSKFRNMNENNIEFKNLEDKIRNLTVPIEKVDFDIYLEIFRDEWQEILDIFQQDVVEVDQRLKILIIKTFSLIKSIKESVDVVRNILEIQTRPTVHESVPYICNKIIANFLRKIQITEKFFEKNKLIQPTVKICESVMWTKSLTKNLQKTFISLQNVECLSTLSSFQEVSELLRKFEIKAQNYIDNIFKEWCGIVILLIKDTLNEYVVEIDEAEKVVDLKKLITVVKKVQIGDDVSLSTSPAIYENSKDIGFGTLSMTLKWIARSKILAENELKKQKLEISKKIEQAHKVSWLEFVGNSLLIEKGFKFKMKFKNEVFDIWKESENLQNEGFKLPTEVYKLLMAKNYLQKNSENLQNLIVKYNKIIDELHPPKILLLKQYLLKMEMHIQPGLILYSWKCTVLENYVDNISRKMNELNCLIYQMNKIFEKLDNLITTIENLNFLPVKNITTQNIKCEEFFRALDNLQKQEIKKCLNIYNTISMTLIQVESLTLLTNTGKSELMAYYYNSYSDKIVLALIKSVLRSLSDFNSLTLGTLPVHFNVKISLENNEIKLHPSCAELHNDMKAAILRVFNRLKSLKHWKTASCIVSKNLSEVFYKRIIADKVIVMKCRELLKSIQNLCDTLLKTTNQWMKYSILWKHDKKLTIKQFANQNPQLSDYEMRFDFYSNVDSKIDQEHSITNTLCVNIEAEMLISQLKSHCYEWKCYIGNQLEADTCETLNQISDIIEKFHASLNDEIINEKILTQVLKTIEDIQEAAFDMELQFYKIEEQYHELIMQNFVVNESDTKHFKKLKNDWENLYDKSLFKKYSTEEVKQTKTHLMKQKIRSFANRCEEFVNRFNGEKKNFQTRDFDATVKKILHYWAKCDELMNEKRYLEIVQKCFEIAPFDFNFLMKVRFELEELRANYKLLE